MSDDEDAYETPVDLAGRQPGTVEGASLRRLEASVAELRRRIETTRQTWELIGPDQQAFLAGELAEHFRANADCFHDLARAFEARATGRVDNKPQP